MTRRGLLLHAWLQVGLFVALALVVNHLSSAAFLRADVTRDQRYTLSEVSRQAVSQLERPLVVRVFYSDDLGPPYNNHEQAVLETLQELAAHSGGRMEIEIADPDDDPEDREEAERYGLQPIPYRFRKGNEFVARDVFLGAALLYGDRVIPVDALAAIETFEYRLVKAIRTLTTPAEDIRTIGYSQGHGELDLLQFPEDNPVGQLVRDLASKADLRPVPLGGDDEIPPDVDLLLVNGPEVALSARAQYQIDQFIMSGRPVALFLRGVRPDFRSGRVRNVRHALYGMLGHYGVQVNRDIIVDREHNEQFEVPIMKGGRMRRVRVPYPPIPVTRELSPSHPITAGLDRAVLPFTSSLTLPEEQPPGVEGQVLVRTEPESGRIEGLIYVRPEVFEVPAPGEETGSWPTVVTLTGRFGSYFADQPIPPPDGRDPDAWNPDPASKIVDSAPTRLLVTGSADMLANNQALVLNAVDWLLEDTDLLEIRTSLAASAAFEPPESGTATAVKAAMVGGPLVILYLLGGVVFLVQRRRA